MADRSDDRWAPRIIDVVGRFSTASNATLLATTDDGSRVIYKPVAGEQPLWDFPDGTLAIREVLTYEVSHAMGLDVVPETVMAGGPFGRGAVQRFVESDTALDPIDLVRRTDASLWPVAVLDIVTNNADRKLGHLIGSVGALRAIDHGLTFHPHDKLRTVLWGFEGMRIPPAVVACVERLESALDGPLGRRVRGELGGRELRALRARIAALLADPFHPSPPHDRPPIPWPPY